MKTCVCCGHTESAAGDTCVLCGEASWVENAVDEKAKKLSKDDSKHEDVDAADGDPDVATDEKPAEDTKQRKRGR